MKSGKTPVSIITGYLGAGKTTLLRKIVDEATERIAILMNEFGEIAIDSKIVKGSNIDMIELSGGCVCCSLTGEFEAAVKEVVEKIKPDMIIVETTGVAEPDALIVNVENIPKVRLDAVITVVDADAMVKFPSLGQTGRIQIEMADIILLNKTDLASKEQIAEIENYIKELNDVAIIFLTNYCDVDAELLFGRYPEHYAAEHERHKIDVEFFTHSTERPLDREKFEEFANSIPKEIYRSKGFVKFKDGGCLFNFVNGRWDLEVWEEVRNTELVFIGKDVFRLRHDTVEKLRQCEV